MRGKRVIVLLVVVLALAAAGATAAFAAAGGNGKGNSESAHANAGQAKKASSQDPSNPDGTYRGKSGSTPDQDGIGADHGLVNNDKTGPGTDGNNGCGNDADREDDDNGWCGNKPAHVKPTPSPTSTGSPTGTPSVSPTATAQAPTEVLGESFTRPSALAGTGVAAITFAFMAVALGVFGFALRTIARPRRR